MMDKGQDENSPQMRELLRQVNAVDVPDYPDHRRGLRWGAFSGIAGTVVLFLLLCLTKLSLLRTSGIALTFGAIVFLLGWAIGAFRPQSR